MAHERPRHVAELLKRLLGFSPLVGIFGHRQVGKTTFASGVAKKYWTLDDRDTRLRIAADPAVFLKRQHDYPVVIDECQQEADLFPALKEHVRTRKRPGQFILTGSVRFTSRKAIRESLAGRLAAVELYPLTLSELLEGPLPEFLPKAMERDFFDESSLAALPSGGAGPAKTQRALDKYLTHGGLPGLCFVREQRLRREALDFLHSLILDRDLRFIVQTRLSLDVIRRYLRRIASNGFNPINHSEIKRELGLAHATQRQLLFALESTYLIRRIPLLGRAGEIVLLEDQYEEHALSDGRLGRSERVLSAVFRNARAQFGYRLGAVASFESYWTRFGARIPLVIRSGNKVLGISIIEGDAPSLGQRRSADSFLRNEPTGKVLFLSEDLFPPRITDRRILVCPVACVL